MWGISNLIPPSPSTCTILSHFALKAALNGLAYVQYKASVSIP